MHRWLPILLLSASVAAQSTMPAAPTAQSPIRLPFTITAKDKKAQPNIDKRLLEIYDNEVPTSAFTLRAPAETGLDLVLLIDISGSSRNKINATKKIAERLVETSNARGYRVFVGLFNDEFAFSETKLSQQEIASLLDQTCFHGPPPSLMLSQRLPSFFTFSRKKIAAPFLLSATATTMRVGA